MLQRRAAGAPPVRRGKLDDQRQLARQLGADRGSPGRCRSAGRRDGDGRHFLREEIGDRFGEVGHRRGREHRRHGNAAAPVFRLAPPDLGE
jgi:hypothetical protein